MSEHSVSTGSDNSARPECRVGPDGTKEWFHNGVRHRDDGPAVEGPDGPTYWFRHGQYHRDDGPAVELPNGTRYWYRNGLRHRDDGPAIERSDKVRQWYVAGQQHREDGPAYESASGYKEWWLVGREVTSETATAYRALTPSGRDTFKSLVESGAEPSVAVVAACELATT